MDNLINDEMLKILEEQNNDNEEYAFIHLKSNFINYNAYVTHAIKEDEKWRLFGYQSIGDYYSKGEILSLEKIKELNELYLSKGYKVIEINNKFRKTKIQTLVKKNKIIEIKN